tara:strand:+ start:1029 stop:2027 length:999 start_codon:yes stop_codon:yes gene_type:complete
MIVISRCPYRISLLGGGSDLDWFVKENQYGISLGYSLSKYTYTVINKLPETSKRGILNYSSREEYESTEDIAHPLIKAAIESVNIKNLLEISSFGFASRGSGLGGSSSFLNAILMGLNAINRKTIDAYEVASIASDIEINKLNKPIGRQDHFISAFGNISAFKFDNQNAEIKKFSLSKEKVSFIEKETKRLYLVPSFVSRSADKVLHKLKDSPRTKEDLIAIRTIAEKFLKLDENREHILQETFNSCINDSWIIKKRMSGVMTGVLNDQYKELNKLPLNWIRLLGAGSGGYFLISSKLDNKSTEEELKNLGMKGFFNASLSKTGVELIHFHE